MRSIIKRSILRAVLLTALSLFLCHCFHLNSKEYLSPTVSYFFDELQMKEHTQMKKLIQPWIHKIQLKSESTSSPADILELTDDVSEGDYLVYLQKAFLIVLSRPPRDDVVQVLLQKLRSYAHTHFDSILTNIVQQACIHIKNKDRSPRERATYFYVLENVIAEIRPYFERNKKAQDILKWIRSAQISIPDSVHKERYIRALEPSTLSPSEWAHNLLTQESS